jgi:hypothetical protein
LLTRDFKGHTYVVKVIEDGFEYDGRTYRSMSAIAGEITSNRPASINNSGPEAITSYATALFACSA